MVCAGRVDGLGGDDGVAEVCIRTVAIRERVGP